MMYTSGTIWVLLGYQKKSAGEKHGLASAASGGSHGLHLLPFPISPANGAQT